MTLGSTKVEKSQFFTKFIDALGHLIKPVSITLRLARPQSTIDLAHRPIEYYQITPFPLAQATVPLDHTEFGYVHSPSQWKIVKGPSRFTRNCSTTSLKPKARWKSTHLAVLTRPPVVAGHIGG